MENKPEIRFQYNDEWSYKSLKKCINSITTGKLDANAAVRNGKYKFFTCSRDDYLTNTYTFDGDAVIINGNGDLGITKTYSGKFDAYQRTYVLMDFTDDFEYIGKAIPKYLPDRIKKEAIGGAMPYIKLDTLTNLLLSFPSKPEQKDIAKFLSNLDKIIDNKKQQLEKTKLYKSSMLSKMFPKEGSLVPEIRFKEFVDEWKIYTFGKQYQIFNGLNKEKDAFGYGSPIINYMDVNKNTLLTDEMIKGRVNLSNDEIKNNIVNPGDILFARTSEVIEEVAFSTAYIGSQNDVVFSGFLLKAAPIIGVNNDSRFIALYMRYASDIRNQISKLATKTSRALINGDNLKNVTLKLPEYDEQKFIADFFTSLDEMISNQEKEIETLEYLKKTLLNKMFA